MNRLEKEKEVSFLSKLLSDNSVILVLHYRGLSVVELEILRRSIVEGGFKVVKNTLIRMASLESRVGLNAFFNGPCAILWSDNIVTSCKLLVSFAKQNGLCQLIGGVFGDTVLSVQDIEYIATLPGEQELRAKLLGLISSVPTKLVNVVNEVPAKIARVIDVYTKNN